MCARIFADGAVFIILGNVVADFDTISHKQRHQFPVVVDGRGMAAAAAITFTFSLCVSMSA